MKTINIGVFDSTKTIARELGKKGSASDFTIFNFKNEKGVLIAYEPTSYPEKLQPLLYCGQLADFILLNASNMDKFFGETLVAAECLAKQGFVITQDESSFRNLSKGMFVNGFKLMEGEQKEPSSMRDFLLSLELSKSFERSSAKMIIDNYFNVKGVGLVLLGKVEGGSIGVHDELTLLPQNKKISIKSIQVQDVDVKECVLGRAGVVPKGVEFDELTKGSILTATPQDYLVTNKPELNCSVSKFTKQGIIENSICYISCGMQFISGTALSSIPPGESKKCTFELEKNIVLEKEERILICNLNQMPRVIGFGILSKTV